MIFKMGYDGQCEHCERPILWEEVDENGDCETCRKAHLQIAKSGLHEGLTDYEMRKMKRMIK